MRDNGESHLYNENVHSFLTNERKKGSILTLFFELSLSAAIFAITIFVFTQGNYWFDSVRLAIFDTFQILQPRDLPARPAVVIDIDEESLSREGRWPWPRHLLARLVDRLTEEGAEVVGVPIVLPEAETVAWQDAGVPRTWTDPGILASELDRTTRGDPVLADALSRSLAVLGTTVDVIPGTRPQPPLPGRFAIVGPPPAGLYSFPGLLRNHGELETASAGVGVMLVAPEIDGVARRAPLLIRSDGQIYPHFALELLRVVGGNRNYIVRTAVNGAVVAVELGGASLPTDAMGTVWIHFSRSYQQRSLPAWMLLDDDVVLPGSLAGRAVVIGSSAAGVGRVWVTSRHQPTTEAEILAQAYESLRDNTFLTSPYWASRVEAGGLLLIAVGFVILRFRRRPYLVILAASTTMVALLWLSTLIAFDEGILIDPSLGSFLIAALLVHSLFFRFLEARGSQAFAKSSDLFMHRIGGNLHDAVYVVDDMGRLLSCNAAGTALIGSDKLERSSDFRLADHLWPAQAERTAPLGFDAMRALSSADSFRDVELHLGEDEVREVQVAVSLVQGPQRTAAIVVLHDVTSRRRAEKQRMVIDRRFRDAVENVDQGFALWDADAKLIMYNRTFADLFRNGDPGIDLGVSADALPEHYGELTTGALAKCRRTRQEHAQDQADQFKLLEFEHRQTGRWFLVIHAETGEGGCVSFYSDITELKRRERDLVEATIRIEMQAADLARFANDLSESREEANAARAAAESASEAKSNFLAMMSHELRTPLNAILGFTDIMLNGESGEINNTKYIEYIAYIQSSGEKLLKIISAILDLSLIEKGKWQDKSESADVGHCVRRWIRLLNDQIETQGLDIVVDIEPELVELWLDPRLLDQIAGNLISNAVKFTPAGGTVTISVSRIDKRTICLSVADTGIGIAAEHMATVLAPFGQIENQLTRHYEGTGLGLPLAKLSAERLGGRLWIDSEVGVGTTVYVTLRQVQRPCTGALETSL